MAFLINVVAFPINGMAFSISGMAQGLAAAPGYGQLALGTKKVGWPWGLPVWGPRATFLDPSATWPRPWPGAAAKPGAIP